MPPKTPAEKMREYRSRMTEEKKAEMRHRNAAQQKASRKKWTKARQKVEKESSKNRMRKTRMRRKAAALGSSLSPSKAFKSPQSFGKAVQRAKRALPSSPRKKQAVIEKLAAKFKIPPKALSVHHRSTALDPHTIQLVENFYESELVSRQLPGKNDFVILRNSTGNKERVQKKMLVMTVMEAYKQFKMDHPQQKIGKSKFAELRPKHILAVTEKDHNVCCCIYHENGQMLLDGIRKAVPSVNLTRDINSFIEQSVCQWSIKCNFGECSKCSDTGKYISSIVSQRESTSVDTDPLISYYQWFSSRHFEKERIESPLSIAQDELACQLKDLKRHCFIATHQLKQIKLLKSSCPEGEGILQEDFAENFALRHQNEVMSAHWNSSTVTIFTAILTSKNKQISFAIISNELRHDKFSVFSFNKLILEYFQQCDRIKTLHIFSDGAGSQFKNRYSLSMVLSPEMLHKELENIDWSFFATSHGKGPIDGIGGTVKRAVWRRVIQGSAIVTNAKDFASIAKEACPNIIILYLAAADMEKDRFALQARWDKCQPQRIPNTHKVHYVRKAGERSVETSFVSPFSSDLALMFTKTELFSKNTPESDVDSLESETDSCIINGKVDKIKTDEFCIGTFVIVKYDSEKFPGIINDVEATTGEVFVSVLHKCTGGWRWPSVPDETWYMPQNVVCTIETPKPVNNRGVVNVSYKF